MVPDSDGAGVVRLRLHTKPPPPRRGALRFPVAPAAWPSHPWFPPAGPSAARARRFRFGARAPLSPRPIVGREGRGAANG